MRIHQVFNPFFIYSKRDRIVPYLSRQHNHLVDLRKLRLFKDKHRGERCFIVGNGPSLVMRDLERLRSEITFAANKIYLAFDQTDWRPSYYVLEDDHIIHQHYEVIRGLKGPVKFISTDWEGLFRGEPATILYRRRLLEPDQYPRFSPNACSELYCGYMVTYISLQLAYFMGFTRVYLIGVDFDYSVVNLESHMMTHTADHPSDHFIPDYFKVGETRYVPQLKLAEQAMSCAKDFYAVNGRKVSNATRGGKLEVFDRISLEEALNE